jgi:DNA/RNA endonuclease YhcR with UshA esterase domain
MRRVSRILCVTVFLFGFTAGRAGVLAQTISAPEAKNHIGETATVCGKVVSTRFASSSHSQPTFLNLDRPYPKQVFAVVIWGSDRPKFDRPEVTYRDKRICVTGEIRSFRGVPEVAARDPSQIKTEAGDRK